jgi:hypothetical protein
MQRKKNVLEVFRFDLEGDRGFNIWCWNKQNRNEFMFNQYAKGYVKEHSDWYAIFKVH